MSHGVIYCASGKRFLEEACHSAESLKRFHPDWSITLFTDAPFESKLFSKVILLDPQFPPLVNRLRTLQQTPYDRTFALDTDTYICAHLGDLFRVLDDFDIAGSNLVSRERSQHFEGGFSKGAIPDSMTQISPGVLLYKKTPETTAFFREWYRIFQRDIARANADNKQFVMHRTPSDMTSFFEAFVNVRVRWMPLSNEFNCVFTIPGSLGMPVKLLHGRHPDHEAVARCLNSIKGPRVHTINGYTMTVRGANGEVNRMATLNTIDVLNEYRRDLQDSIQRRGLRQKWAYVVYRMKRFRRRLGGQLRPDRD